MLPDHLFFELRVDLGKHQEKAFSEVGADSLGRGVERVELLHFFELPSVAPQFHDRYRDRIVGELADLELLDRMTHWDRVDAGGVWVLNTSGLRIGSPVVGKAIW